MKRFALALGLLVSLSSVSVFAAEGSSRATDKLGVSAGFLTNPMPSVYGGGLNYNLMPWLRATASVGKITGSISSTTGTTDFDFTTFSGEGKLLLASGGSGLPGLYIGWFF